MFSAVDHARKEILVGVLQRNKMNRRYNYQYVYIEIERYKEMCYKELAHWIIEAGKSHDLLSVSWTARSPSGIVSVQV